MDDGAEERNRRRFSEAVREERPDLALLCLLIGVEATHAHGQGQGRGKGQGQGGEDGAVRDPGEELVDEAQVELDRLAGLLPFERGRTPDQWARAMERLLGEEHGFHGSPGDYQRLDSSLLHAVLRRRRGLPILLSVVWMEVARRAGAPVYGVALPGHFVVGFGDPLGAHALADPFGGGKPLSDGDLELLLAGATGARTPVSTALLQPAGPLETVQRVLNNIRAWAGTRPEQSAVRLWAVELSLLLPHHPGHLRFERAQLLVERGEFARGAREMEEYADVVAAMEPNAADKVRRAARAARARLN
ncbi:transglutaminase-like domain-containing protein [Streptomyces iconiensis]|uniref:Transglutaminase-like domain-containing protein n=1 Tax=Streptomyces iconiensis TaxID=1384038 RepID=A0ABT7A5S8_9ACTN|nr:transglutaminase-like domain-containing protein [Streptomyces iconiensis]MDJ1136703.1 transglutaminase-like domain-containing protein [Streptomyces iconiensis]